MLRPGGTLDPPPYDLMPETMHVAAVDGDRVVGCVTVFPSPFVDEPHGWQLRGMAVDPAYQGQGIGRRVLDTAVEVAGEAGVPLLWANGRLNVMPFYERAGWTSIGGIFPYGPANLEHMVIVRRLSASGRTVS